MKIPQVCPWLGEEEAGAAGKAIRENWITEGPRTKEFSEKLNQLLGVKWGVFAPNGTLALALGLLALDIKAGDEVIIPDTTFIASANAVVLVGATPIFVDVNRENFQIDVNQCEELITPRTKAIMPVHLYGMSANMDAVMNFARKHNLKVIEDAAQAVGVKYNGKQAGTFGDVGCFSFFADKTITIGEGGYVVCNDEKVYEKLLYLRNQGRLDRGSFVHPAIGFNFRITDMQAAIGLVQLGKLNSIIERKLKILNWYKQKLESLNQVKFLTLEPKSTRIPFRVVLFCENAHKLMEYFTEKEIQSRTFFYPLHQQPCFAYLSKGKGGNYDLSDSKYPNAIYGYEHGICLPVFPTLAEEQVDYICQTIKDFYDKQL